MRRRPLVLLALVIAACARGGSAPKPDLIATYESCLAEQVYLAALDAGQPDSGAFVAYSRARWRAYAAHDSAVNHARNAPADSARYQHLAKLHFGAAQARDRRMRAANLSTYYAESLADAAATNACRANTPTETAAR